MKPKILFFLFAIIFLPSVVSGQNNDLKTKKKVTITGLIVDKDKKPVAGAEIFIDSVKTVYTTDSQGKFRINVRPGANHLFVISAEHGFASADINGQTAIDLTLNGDKAIPAFVAEAIKKDATASPRKPKKINTYTDIYQMIRQEVPGVLVTGRSIVVQQPNSFFGSTQPLFVVNGAIVPSIDYISPVEVKKIELLKGSYATKYGLEGANGVISITLFSGSNKDS